MSAGNLQTVRSLSTHLYVALAALLMSSAAPAMAWWGDGHAVLSRASVLALPQHMPAFFRQAGPAIAHVSYDPDVAKNRGVPQVSHAEYPEHFFDVELLEGQAYPSKRYEFISLCQQLGVSPEKVGFAPYAIAEWTQRLAVAFAEHRRWPEDELIRAKIIVYAGFVAHYSQDLAQPLHGTIHYDGRVGADGESPHSGIHGIVDSAIQRMALDPEELARQAQVIPIDGDLFDRLRYVVSRSNQHVDGVYALASQLKGEQGPSTEEGRRFIHARAVEATQFTASLYVTAWELSESLRLPGWLQR